MNETVPMFTDLCSKYNLAETGCEHDPNHQEEEGRDFDAEIVFLIYRQNKT